MEFEKKLRDAVTMTIVFGRCVMVFEGKGLPKALKIIHPRDLGRVFLDQKTWDLEKVITTFPADELFRDEMLYLVNRPDSPKRRTMWYGYSEMQRVAGASRAWRRLIEFDFPEVATSMWAGYGMFLIKKMGRTKADAENDMNTLLNSLKSGAFNAVSVDANDEIEYKEMDLKPKIQEMVQLADFYERIIIGIFAVPSALLGREEDQNRATLIGKIQFFLSGVVKSRRDWISDQISKQWYERNMIKMGMAALLQTVRVKAEFDSIIVESWFDLVDAVLRVKGIFPDMPDDQLLELLNLEEYKSELAQAPTRATDVPQGNVPVNSPQDIVNNQTKSIDDALIKVALDGKKLEVLGKIDAMIQAEQDKKKALTASEFKEQEHERDPDGKFTSDPSADDVDTDVKLNKKRIKLIKNNFMESPHLQDEGESLGSYAISEVTAYRNMSDAEADEYEKLLVNGDTVKADKMFMKAISKDKQLLENYKTSAEEIEAFNETLKEKLDKAEELHRFISIGELDNYVTTNKLESRENQKIGGLDFVSFTVTPQSKYFGGRGVKISIPAQPIRENTKPLIYSAKPRFIKQQDESMVTEKSCQFARETEVRVKAGTKLPPNIDIEISEYVSPKEAERMKKKYGKLGNITFKNISRDMVDR